MTVLRDLDEFRDELDQDLVSKLEEMAEEATEAANAMEAVYGSDSPQTDNMNELADNIRAAAEAMEEAFSKVEEAADHAVQLQTGALHS